MKILVGLQLNVDSLPKKDLLFGMFAWRLGLIDQSQMSDAVKQCLAASDIARLDLMLVQLGHISEETRCHISKLLVEQLNHQDGDERQSLARMNCDESTIKTILETDNELIDEKQLAGGSADSLRPMELEIELQKLIGCGGLGQVWKATDKTLRRQIAVKQIREDFAENVEARERFRREAAITGQLQHPGVVSVYGSGVDTAGRPYYTMQLVDGVSLSKSIAAFHLTGDNYDSMAFRELIDRLSDVAQTICYAHSVGVLHRDLKPDNILVGDYGETLVIDWGLAKSESTAGSVSQELTRNQLEPTSQTQQGRILGTLGYASPEQIQGRVVDVDERSDVYSLGAILYQILTGRPPVVREQEDLDELIEKVCVGDFLPPQKFNSKSPKSLSAICMKALACEADARYSSVDTFLQDIEFWKADQPVSVIQDSISDRLARFSRQNRSAVVASGVALLGIAMVSTAALLIVNNSRANEFQQRRKAERLAIKKSELAQEKTTLADEKTALAKTNQEVVDHFVSAFKSPSPNNRGIDAEMSAVEVLQSALLKIDNDESLAAAPQSKSKLLAALGRSFNELGKYESALAAYSRARKLAAVHLGDSNPDTLKIIHGLGACHQNLGQYDKALEFFKEAYDLRKSILGLEHEDTATSLSGMATAHSGAGRFKQAISLFEENVRIKTKIFGASHEETARAVNNLAFGFRLDGRNQKAIEMYRQSFDILKLKLGVEHPETLLAMNNLGAALYRVNDTESALDVLEKSLALSIGKLGLEHPKTLSTANNLASIYFRSGKREEALKKYQQVYEGFTASLGPTHIRTLQSLGNYAYVLKSMGRHEEALELNEQSFKAMVETQGPENPATIKAMANLAANYSAVGRLGEAIDLMEENVDLAKKVFGDSHQETLISMNNLAGFYADGKRLGEAIQIYEKILPLKKKKLGESDPSTLVTMHALANTYYEGDQVDKARELFEQNLALQEQTSKAGDPRLAQIKQELAVTYLGDRRFEAAVALLLEAVDIREQKLGPVHKDTLTSYRVLCLAYIYSNDLDSAREIVGKLKNSKVLEMPRGSLQPCMAMLEIADRNFDKAIEFVNESIAAGSENKVLKSEAGFLKNMLAILKEPTDGAWADFETEVIANLKNELKNMQRHRRWLPAVALKLIVNDLDGSEEFDVEKVKASLESLESKIAQVNRID